MFLSSNKIAPYLVASALALTSCTGAGNGSGTNTGYFAKLKQSVSRNAKSVLKALSGESSGVPVAANGFTQIPLDAGYAEGARLESTGVPLDWGYVERGAVITYTLFIEAEGIYSLDLGFASPSGETGVDVEINDSHQLSVPFTSTGDWWTYTRVNAGSLTLPAGEIKLVIRAQNDGFNISEIALTGANIIASTEDRTPASVPVPIAQAAPPSESGTPLVTVDSRGMVLPPRVQQPSQNGDIVGFIFQNNTSAEIPARLITFGQPFVSGQVNKSARLQARIGGQTVPVQMDVKTTNSDGSVRFAVLTMQQPKLAPRSQVDVMLSSSGSSQENTVDLSSQYNTALSLELQFSDGSRFQSDLTAQLKKALGNNGASYWLRGSLATQARVTLPVHNALRLVVDFTQYADGQSVADLQVNNDVAVGPAGGRESYTAVVRFNGQTKSYPIENHWQYSQWHQVYYSHGKPKVNVQHDVDYTIRSNAVLPYNTKMGINPGELDNYGHQLAQGGDWESPFGHYSNNPGWPAYNGIYTNMPGVGDREDIGPLNRHNVIWLLTQDERARDYALAGANVSANIPWHFWDAKNNRWLNSDDYPQLWLDPRGGDSPPYGLTQRIPYPENSGWDPETAHMPDLSFLAYLMTGSRFNLDQLNSQAHFAIMYMNPGSRSEANAFVLNGRDQTRAQVWSVRQLNRSAYYGADGTWDQSFFLKTDANNWEHLRELQLSTNQGEVYGWITEWDLGDNGEVSPWNQDYAATIMVEAVRHGSPYAMDVLKHASNFLLGRLLNQHKGFDIHDSATYRHVLYRPGTRDANLTWKEVSDYTYASGWGMNGTRSNTNYPQLVYATTALVYATTKDARALDAFKIIHGSAKYDPSANLVDGVFQSDPRFSFVLP